MKKNKGITLINLVLLIVILIILSTVVIKNMDNGTDFRNYTEMCSDIELLHDKILIYYNKYSELPTTGDSIVLPAEIPNGTYYEIDLTKLNYLTLNYGNKTLGENDYYIINTNTFDVYYLLGLEYKNEIRYAKIEE